MTARTLSLDVGALAVMLGHATVAVPFVTVLVLVRIRSMPGNIVEAARDCAERQVVITHGTDTMVETARALAVAVKDKTIVLTGAMVPFAFGSSDGLFNLGSALSFAQILPAGVYVAMNGRWFAWDDVRKNRELGVFESIKGS